MDVSVSTRTSIANGSNIPIDSWTWVYKAAICPQVDSSKLQEVLSKLQEGISRVTVGPENTVLHLASAAGNLQFIQQIVRLNLQREFIEKANANGNTALHEAALRGHHKVVELLLHHHGSLLNAANVNGNTALHEAAEGGHDKVVDILLHHGSFVNVHNKLRQTPLFKACEGGHSKIAEKLLKADPSKLLDKSSDGRTCLHAVINGGQKGLLQYLLTYYNEKNLGHERRDLLKEMDGQGNTVLHLAARRNRLDMVKVLLEREPILSYSANNDEETAVFVALKLGFPPIVEELVKCSPDSIQIASKNGKNILHLAVELSQVKILTFLVESKVDLSRLINQPDEAPPKDKVELIHDKIREFLVEKLELSQLTNQPDKGPPKDKTHGQVEKLELSQLINQPDEGPPKDKTHGQEDGNQNGGDTPLHIAARNKNANMVDLLLKVPGVNKNAVNSAGLTPLDIARENTEYHESYKIIQKLSAYPPKCRPFLYSTPTMSPLKRKKAVEILDNIFADKRNVDLIVAALLATMTFTAVFTVPGGFHTEPTEDEGSYRYVLGMPVLIRYDSFKLFLIFDCVAFYLSLFVVLMWVMSSPLNTGDKMLFMCVTSAVLCMAFAFTAYGLMAAVYSVLASPKLFAWIVLGSSMVISFSGTLAFFYMAAKFMVMRARFHSLCGIPRLLDGIAEDIWLWAEKQGILDVVRTYEDKLRGLVSGNIVVRPYEDKLRGPVSGNIKEEVEKNQ